MEKNVKHRNSICLRDFIMLLIYIFNNKPIKKGGNKRNERFERKCKKRPGPKFTCKKKTRSQFNK